MGLVVTMQRGQWIRIGDTFVQMQKTPNGNLRLVIEAPPEIHIDRIVDPECVRALEQRFTSNSKTATRKPTR